MNVYRSRYSLLPGTSFTEVMSAARREYHAIQKRTPRRIPYVRSGYFIRSKVFLNTFWEHLHQKHPADQTRRLKYYLCAIDLMRHSRETPDTIISQENLDILLHRFYGVSRDGQAFTVQIKESKRSSRKDFLSVFPSKNGDN